MDVHVPSKDYYRKAGDADQETISLFKFYNEFDTPEAATQFLSDNKDDLEGEFIILPSYKFTKK